MGGILRSFEDPAVFGSCGGEENRSGNAVMKAIVYVQ
jgi:hypothetical protein